MALRARRQSDGKEVRLFCGEGGRSGVEGGRQVGWGEAWRREGIGVGGCEMVVGTEGSRTRAQWAAMVAQQTRWRRR